MKFLMFLFLFVPCILATELANDCLLENGSPCVVDTNKICPFTNVYPTIVEETPAVVCPPDFGINNLWCCNYVARVFIESVFTYKLLSPVKTRECCYENFNNFVCTGICSPSSSLFIEHTSGLNYTLWISPNATHSLYESCKDSCNFPYDSEQDFLFHIGTIPVDTTLILASQGINISIGTVSTKTGYNPTTHAALYYPYLKTCGKDLFSCNCYTSEAPLDLNGPVCQHSASCCANDRAISSTIEKLGLNKINASICVSTITELLCTCLCNSTNNGIGWNQQTIINGTLVSPIDCYISSNFAVQLYRSCTCTGFDWNTLITLRELWPNLAVFWSSLEGKYQISNTTISFLNFVIGNHPRSGINVGISVPYTYDGNCSEYVPNVSSSIGFLTKSYSSEKKPFNTKALIIGLSITAFIIIVISIAILGVCWYRKQLKKRPKEITEIEMLNIFENEQDASSRKAIYLSKTVLCFTPAMTVEVGKICRDIIILKNFSTSPITICLLPCQKSSKFTLEFKPNIPTIVQSREQIELIFEIVLHCTTTIQLEVPLDLGEGGTKTRISAAVSSAPSYLLDWDELKVGQKLGDGASATVLKGSYRGLDIALKCFRCVEIDEELRQSYLSEAKLLMGLHHPNIISLYGICEHPQLTMVLEFAPFGSLGNLLQKKDERITYPLKLRIAQDTVKGMSFLHSCNVLHRDLKPDNLLLFSVSVDAPVIAKLSDFGTSRLVLDNSTKSYTRGVGTPAYMSPEVLQGKAYSMKADVYSFGILLWQLMTTKIPYEECENMWLILNIVCEGKRLSFDGIQSSLVKEVISECWDQNADLRPDFQVIMSKLEQIAKETI